MWVATVKRPSRTLLPTFLTRAPYRSPLLQPQLPVPHNLRVISRLNISAVRILGLGTSLLLAIGPASTMSAPRTGVVPAPGVAGLDGYRLSLRIEDPNDKGLSSFYRALSQTAAGSGTTRALQYGDSHVASDLLTGEMRQKLQSRFGNGGPGLILPVKPWPWYSRLGFIGTWTGGWKIDGARDPESWSSRHLGLAGLAAVVDRAGESIAFAACAESFDFYLIEQPGGGTISIWIDGEEIEREISLRSKATIPFYLKIDSGAETWHAVELRTTRPGKVRVFGVDVRLETPGVVYDELGINGARAIRQLMWDRDLLRSNLQRTNPDLVIVAYGSNEVTDADLDLGGYEMDFAEMLRRFREAAPNTSLLVIGPPDRAIRSGLKWRSVERLPSLISAQRRAALSAGAAFCNVFSAMGGAGSINRWAGLTVPLSQQDRVHLTRAGYKVVAQALYEALMRGYERM